MCGKQALNADNAASDYREAFGLRVTDARWHELSLWLGSRDGSWLLDELVLGTAPLGEIIELLEDFGIRPSPESYARFGRLADELLGEGF